MKKLALLLFLLPFLSVGINIKSGEVTAISSDHLSKIFDDAAGQEIPLDVVNEIRKFTEGTELTITETSHNLLNRPSRVSWEQLGDKLFDRMMVHEEIHDEKGEQVGTVNYDRTIDR